MKIDTLHALKSKTGITLIELLIVIVIVGILAAIAVPLYTGYMQRARRVDAKTALEQLRASQETRRAEKGGYALTLVELQNTWGAPASPAGDYNITMVPTTLTFTGTATPIPGGRQVSDGWLGIDQDGAKTSQYPDKWAK